MAFDIATVTAHIAALRISGVRTLDFSDIKEQADIRLCPQFMPDVTRQISFESVMRDSFGDGSTAAQTLYYTIPYVLLYEPIGSTRGMRDIFTGMVAAMSRIITAPIENDTPQSNGRNSDLSVDMQINSFTLGGTVNDPSGVQFHGVQVDVIVREFIN